MSEAAFAAAVGRAAHAAELVNRTQAPDDQVTQFEALTASAYHELAHSGVEVAVVEAGLGGRFDATSVIPSKVQVLTSVGLEHTRWLGPTLTDIAEEKLAVVRERGTLVTGELDPGVARGRRARGRGASRPAGDRGRRGDRPGPAGRPDAFSAATSRSPPHAAEAFLGRPLDEPAVRRAAAETRIPGRLDVVGRASAGGARRRPQPGRRRGARRVARRSARRPPPARGGDRGARGQGRGGHAGGAARSLRPRGLHPLPQSALAVAGHAGHPRREARRRRRPRRWPSRTTRSSARRPRGAARRGAGHRLDLPDRRPGARARRRRLVAVRRPCEGPAVMASRTRPGTIHPRWTATDPASEP